MSVELEEAPTTADTDREKISHNICCINENIALCGKDMTGKRWCGDEGPQCVDCAKMHEINHCPVVVSCCHPHYNPQIGN